MRVEVADVEAPVDRPLDLGPALAPHLVEVGVVPHVVDRAREAAVAVEEGRRMRDRAPAVEVVLRVQREVHADVLAPIARRRLAGPRARHHQRRARRRPVAQRLVDAHVGGVAGAEVVAVQDDQARVGVVPERLRQRRRHDIRSYPQRLHNPRPAERASSAARAISASCATLGRNGYGRAYPSRASTRLTNSPSAAR